MKHPIALIALCISGAAMAQQPPASPYNKKYLDSLLGEGQKKQQPFVLPNPNISVDPNTVYLNRARTFKDYNPGAVFLQQTTRGKLYSVAPDNMPVLVPDMNTVEAMPGSSRTFKVPPQSKMPNPLYPQRKDKKKQKE
jgi:hypothetical protein